MLKYKVLGITDERDSCDCCGRTNLKRTVVLEEIDTGAIVYFGTTCAATAQGWTAKEMATVSKATQDARDADIERSRRLAHAHKIAAWETWLRERTGINDTFRAIESLGGYAAANLLYRT